MILRDWLYALDVIACDPLVIIPFFRKESRKK